MVWTVIKGSVCDDELCISPTLLRSCLQYDGFPSEIASTGNLLDRQPKRAWFQFKAIGFYVKTMVLAPRP